MNREQPMSGRTGTRRAAFTLVELLVVMAIILILLGVVVPGLKSALGGTDLTRAGETLTNTLALARQVAVTSNREVEVRFFDLGTGGQPNWCGIQLWRVDETVNGQSVYALNAMQLLPASTTVSVDAALSPLLTANTSIKGNVVIAAYANPANPAGPAYQGFRFRSNGSPDLTVTGKKNFLTLQKRIDRSAGAGVPPKDYCTVQVDPVTGRSVSYRP